MADTVPIPQGAQIGSVPIPDGATIGAAPTGMKSVKSTAYTQGEKALRQLPLAGGVLGGLLGSESGPGAVGTAALGGVIGEDARQLITKMLGWDTPKTETPKAALGGMAKEGAIQGFNEATGRLLAKPVAAFGRTMMNTHAASSLIPMLPSQAGAKSALYTWGERFVSNAIPSGGIMREFQIKQAAKATEGMLAELQNISKFKGTPEQAGELVQKAIEKYRDTYKKTVIEPAYNEITKLVEAKYGRVPVSREVTSALVDESGKPINYMKRVLEKQQISGLQTDTRQVKQLAIPILRQLREQKALIDPKLLADSESILTSIVTAPKQVPFQVMQHSRSDLLAISRKLEEALPGKRAGIIKRLIGGLDSSLEASADRSGIPGLGEKLRSANRLTFEMHRRFDQQLVTKILATQKPEMVSAYVRKAGLQELRDMQGMLTPPQNRMVQARVVNDLMDESADKGAFNPLAFSKKFKSMGEERGKELFGQNYRNLKVLSDLFEKVGSGKVGEISPASLHNLSFILGIPSAATALALGHVGVAAATAGGLTAEAVGLRAFAKAITNPAKSAIVARYISGVLRGSPYAADALRRTITSPDGGSNEQAQGEK